MGHDGGFGAFWGGKGDTSRQIKFLMPPAFSEKGNVFFGLSQTPPKNYGCFLKKFAQLPFLGLKPFGGLFRWLPPKKGVFWVYFFPLISQRFFFLLKGFLKGFWKKNHKPSLWGPLKIYICRGLGPQLKLPRIINNPKKKDPEKTFLTPPPPLGGQPDFIFPLFFSWGDKMPL